jgi:hypothetical protein
MHIFLHASSSSRQFILTNSDFQYGLSLDNEFPNSLLIIRLPLPILYHDFRNFNWVEHVIKVESLAIWNRRYISQDGFTSVRPQHLLNGLVLQQLRMIPIWHTLFSKARSHPDLSKVSNYSLCGHGQGRYARYKTSNTIRTVLGLQVCLSGTWISSNFTTQPYNLISLHQ